MARKPITHDDVTTRNGLGTVSEMTDRVLSYWSRGTDADRESGALWYGADSGALLAGLVSLGAESVEHAAAATSHMSPRTTWARNVAGVTALVGQGRNAALALGCMSAGVDRAIGALESADPISTLNGPKTRRFALNLLGDMSAVTVDVWAARIAFPEGMDTDTVNRVIGRVGVYNAIEHAYRAAAESVGVSPATMQATTWIVARNGRAG